MIGVAILEQINLLAALVAAALAVISLEINTTPRTGLQVRQQLLIAAEVEAEDLLPIGKMAREAEMVVLVPLLLRVRLMANPQILRSIVAAKLSV